MPTRAKRSKKITSKRRHRTSAVTQLEDLSPELFFNIFDYLTGNEIFKCFSKQNTYFDELIQHTPNVHLNLSRSQSKFYRIFRKVLPLENIISMILVYDSVDLLDELISTGQVDRLRSLTLLKTPLRAFESKIPDRLRALNSVT